MTDSTTTTSLSDDDALAQISECLNKLGNYPHRYTVPAWAENIIRERNLLGQMCDISLQTMSAKDDLNEMLRERIAVLEDGRRND